MSSTQSSSHQELTSQRCLAKNQKQTELQPGRDPWLKCLTSKSLSKKASPCLFYAEQTTARHQHPPRLGLFQQERQDRCCPHRSRKQKRPQRIVRRRPARSTYYSCKKPSRLSQVCEFETSCPPWQNLNLRLTHKLTVMRLAEKMR